MIRHSGPVTIAVLDRRIRGPHGTVLRTDTPVPPADSPGLAGCSAATAIMWNGTRGCRYHNNVALR